MLNVGIDIGSTTVKFVAINEKLDILYSSYERHFSDIKKTLLNLLEHALEKFPKEEMTIRMTGSGGLSISKWMEVTFIQEVIASVNAVEKFVEGADVAIELGGEDAKITFFHNGIEQRMNGTCAGGTGAFIDQMAGLLSTDPKGLNELAKTSTLIYPIAARCGVFAKSDIQPLLNEGAKKSDIAKSIFQSVVNQTISGLACGMPIRGKVVFLGGPLTFLDQLGVTFKETLKLSEADAVFPKNGELYVALGAAIDGIGDKGYLLADLISKIGGDIKTDFDVERLQPLFNDEDEYKSFTERHNKNKVVKVDLRSYSGDAFLGIDCGSTTAKMVLAGRNGELLYQFYKNNEGSPLKIIRDALLDLYELLPNSISIKNSAVTGYGEALIKAALCMDIGEIETVAHQRAAEHFLPGVDFILDIGGQDMKCITAKEGVIYSVLLNEACSAGCGSFLENFAQSLHISMSDFVKFAIEAKTPVDLGSRCTVFMNSKVKQSQKEGASVGDIASGLAYSVVKNTLYKVIRLRSEEELGNKIIVQGGTFLNDAVLRAFEKITNREVVRPDISGIMGAYGCALIAKDRYKEGDVSTLIGKERLRNINLSSTIKRCGLCANNCPLTIHEFEEGNKYISGNRCERGLGKEVIKNDGIPNIYKYKYERTFAYKPLKAEEGRKTVGIPRVLNMYENYPFWHTFFQELDYRVIISGHSSKKIYEKGIETIPSESVCYPAKISHGHIIDLIDKKVDFIFYPSVFFESKEVKEANNQYNCPIVMGYPDVIKGNVERLSESKTEYINPFISFHDKEATIAKLLEVFTKKGHSSESIIEAFRKAILEQEQYRQDIRKKGEETLHYLKDNNLKGIVLAGRPYHVDPEINHKIDELIVSFGYAVLTEDSIYHLGQLERPIRVVDQWVYHSRLYMAADVVAHNPNLEMIQLNSFGCGLDAVTTDMVQEILERFNKIYTVLKIDEVSNLGSARIRIRSLKAAIEAREGKNVCYDAKYETTAHLTFTKAMRENYTIIAPQMSPIHFKLVGPAIRGTGLKVDVLEETTALDLEEGLRHVHNDACYPALLVTGQLIRALKSGKYDTNKVALIITQTGGGCRATNYIAFIRKAVKDAGFPHVPVIGIGAVEKHEGFSLNFDLTIKALKTILLGDLLMRVSYRMRPYELTKGMTDELVDKWIAFLAKQLEKGNFKHFNKTCKKIIKEFDNIPVNDQKKPRVGLVGEILVKYHDFANNNVVRLVEKEGGEAVMPDMYDFFLFTIKNYEIRNTLFHYKKKPKIYYQLAIWFMEVFRSPIKRALRKSKHFTAPHHINHTAAGARQVLSLGNQTGEGWFLTGEMINLIESGTSNIICMQPFACLPNHVVGKGMIKVLRNKYPLSNIVAVDYDPGASEVNQINRIKLMMAVAFKNLNKQ